MEDCLASRASDIRHIPTEVCENIIDMLYSPEMIDGQVANSNTLCRCALVCRAWRVRSQRMLFYCVILHDSATLQRFATVLTAGPHLGDYVHQLTLVGRTLHNTANPLSLFSILLLGKLPRLRHLATRAIGEDEDWFVPAYKPVTEKPLPYTPLHPRFPLFLSTFTTVTRLDLNGVTFQTFGDFARTINSLPALHYLICYLVHWVILGSLPFFMHRLENGSSIPRPPSFAPELKWLSTVRSSLYVCESYTFNVTLQLGVDIHGIRRLIAACGPQLTTLWIRIPFLEEPTRVRASMSSSYGRDKEPIN